MEPEPVYEISGWRKLALWPLSVLVRLWGATIRLRIDPHELEILTRKDSPTVIILWHNRLFLAASVFRRFRKHRGVCGLVSASRDGAWLAAFFSLMGLGSVRGSSNQRTLESSRELMKALQSGKDIGLTPDGPRGPRYSFKKGAVRVALKSGAPIMLISGRLGRSWRLHSWDRFYLPVPFSRAEMKVRYFPHYESLGAESVEEAAAFLKREMMEISPDPDE